MYGKVFQQIYKGTLAMVGPWEALVTFQQFIVLANKHGEVDMTADAISRETTIPLAIITKGIEALQSPDPESRSPDEEGRRIVLLSEHRTWGWRIVNYDHYRKLRSDEERREYHARYWREKRSPAAKKAATQQTQHDSTNSTNSSKQEVEVSKKVAPLPKRKPKKKKAAKDLTPVSEIEGLNLDAWGKWLSHRTATNKPVYTTNGIAIKLAKLPYDNQMACVESSIDLAYTGLFPDKFTGNGNEANHRGKPTVTDHIERLKRQAHEHFGE